MMIEADRRSFIAGAIATLFAGITPVMQPIEVKVQITIQGHPPLWNEIFNEMLRGYVQAFGVGPVDNTPDMELVYSFTDAVYGQFIALEAAYDSLKLPPVKV